MIKYIIVCLIGLICQPLSALDYKACVGTYAIDVPATLAFMKSTITPENERQINDAIKEIEQQKDMMAYVTFMLNAKSIDFKLDDGANPVTKQVAVINSIDATEEGGLNISTTPSDAPGNETIITIFLYETKLVLKADNMSIVLQKR